MGLYAKKKNPLKKQLHKNGNMNVQWTQFPHLLAQIKIWQGHDDFAGSHTYTHIENFSNI